MMKTLNLKTLDGKTLGKLALTVMFGLGVYSYLQERGAPTPALGAPTVSNPTPRAGFAPRSSMTPQNGPAGIGQSGNGQEGWGNVPNAEQPIGGPNTIAPIYRNQGVNGGQGAYPSSGAGGYSDSPSSPQNGGYGNADMGGSPMIYGDPSSYAAPAQTSGSSDYAPPPNYGSSGNFDPAAGVAPAAYSKFNDPAYIQGQEEQHLQERDLLGGTTTYKDDQGNYVQTDGSNGAAYQDPNSGNVATYENTYDAPPVSSSYTQELAPLGGGSSEVPSTPAPEVAPSAE